MKFRDTAQEYTDKRMATQSPVLFFVTKEISWVKTEQIKAWGQGMADGCHTKNKQSQKFRQALVQVGDLLLGRKSAPAGFTKPVSPAVCSMTPITSPMPKERRSGPLSPEQAAPSGSASASKPKPKAPSAAEQFAEQQERSRNAILGGVSRDERHRRRTEGRTSDNAVQSQPSQSEVPQPSPVKPAEQSPQQGTESRRDATQPAHSTAAEQGPLACQPAATAPAAPLCDVMSADPSTAHTEQRRFSSDGVLLKRHTRSQGTAELGVSDLQNLEPRKAPRRALSCVAPAATSCMGSRGTGDGATGRAPATDTPRSVGTHPRAGPFAEGKPSANSAPPLSTCKPSLEIDSRQAEGHAEQLDVKERSPFPCEVEDAEAAEDCLPSSDREPPAAVQEQAPGRANCTSAASHMPTAAPEAAVPSLASTRAADPAKAPDEVVVDDGDTSARDRSTAAPLSRSVASGGHADAAPDCIMEDASKPAVEAPALQDCTQPQEPADGILAAGDLQGAIDSQDVAPAIAAPAMQGNCQKPLSAQALCKTNGHIHPEATSGMETPPSAEVDEPACASPEQASDCAPMQGDTYMEAKEEVLHDEIMLNPVIKSVEPQQRNGTAEHVLQQAPSSTIDSTAEQREEVEGDSKSTAKRPPRRAAANRKSALEMVRGEAARGTRSEAPRASRTGEAASRTQTAR